MSGTFTVCSYNMGTDIRDYALLYDFVHKDENQLSDTQLSEPYSKAEIKVKTLLKDQADVYCFQEFGKIISIGQGGPPERTFERPLTCALLEKKFTIIQSKFRGDMGDTISPTDAVIMLDSNRFTDIENHSIDQYRAIAVATDRLTNQKIAFASIHATGFAFNDSIEKLQKDYQCQNGPYQGDQDCDTLVMKLTKLKSQTDLQIIGGDMNASPEVWKNRFDIFAAKEIQVIRTHTPTAANSRDELNQEREIDYFFVYKKIEKFAGWIQSIFSKSILYTVSIDPIIGFNNWSTTNNASDHKPIRATFTPQKSYLFQFISAISNLFSGLRSANE